uniref:Uncharacterized protein n=1 Tax=Romanomermis culicivorax TaxID=13658 RepID=A0A915JG08_ROMCU
MLGFGVARIIFICAGLTSPKSVRRRLMEEEDKQLINQLKSSDVSILDDEENSTHSSINSLLLRIGLAKF